MKVKKVSIALFILAVLCLVGLLPVTRQTAVAIAEGRLGRALNYARTWNEIMIACSLVGFAMLAVLGVAYNVFDFPKFVPAHLQTSGFRHYSIKSDVKILADKRFALAFALVFAALVSVRCYWISQKKSYYWDELHSFAIANRNVYGSWDWGKYSKPFETSRLYTGKELKEGYHWNDSSLRDTLSDLFHLWVNNSNDSAHPNLYLVLFRAWFVGAKTYDFKEIIWRGCSLNLVIFAFSYYFMFVLLSRFTQNKANILLCLFIAFCNPHTISSTLFLRDYELQTCIFILFAVLFADSFLAIFNNQRFESKRNFILGAFLIALFLLSGYFSLIFAAFLGLSLLVLALRKDQEGRKRQTSWFGCSLFRSSSQKSFT